MGFRAATAISSYPQRPDRCYLGYIDGGMYIGWTSRTRSRPKPIAHWDNPPPYLRLYAHDPAAV